MMFRDKLLIAAILVFTAAFGQRVLAGTCSDTAAAGPSGQTNPGTNTGPCTDGTSCGRTTSYTPPDGLLQSCVVILDMCCINQIQRPYTQTWSCTPIDPNDPTKTTCTAGPKVYSGGPMAVKITVGCTPNPPDDCLPAGGY
jgi:hypothetical protein